MGSVRARLSVMMFLQYFVWGAWAVEMGGYMGGVLGFSGLQIGSVYSTTAIAAMLSPLFMGYIADRWLATEKVLALLHLVGAALLAGAAIAPTMQTFSLGETTFDLAAHRFEVLYGLMLVYALCYMPTLALTNSISFANIADSEKDFPLIRVFGTIGWIAAGLVVGFVLKAKPESYVYDYVLKSLFDVNSDLFKTLFAANNFIYLAAASSALLGLFCFALPHTPPKPRQAVATSDSRQSVLHLLGEPSFLVFVLASFLICIPLAFYYNLANLFLQQTDAPYPTALQTIGQVSEVFFMAIMPWFIVRLGVKKMLAIGMLAWVVRYACFGSLQFPAIVFGLVLHGICYDFFFVASQIYVDTKADVTQRARAQAFIAFVTLGLGMFVGAYVGGYIYDRHPPEIQATAVKTETVTTPLPAWDEKGAAGLAKEIELRADTALDLAQLPDSYTEEAGGATLQYRKEDLAGAARRADRDGDGKIARSEWEAARASDWFGIWLWPAIGAGITLLFFWLGFRDRAVEAGRK